MGLDMYAYVSARAGHYDDYVNEYYGEDDDLDSDSPPVVTISKPTQIAYWRKHPNLHGWFRRLYERKNKLEFDSTVNSFNGIELELTREDIDALEADILGGSLSSINETGFFFGDPSDNRYKDTDLKFIIDARSELFMGLKVFYNSSW